MKKFLPGILALASILVLSGCGGGSGGSDSRRFSGTDNEISAFAFTQAGNSTSGLSSDTTGLISDRTITLEVPSGTDVTALVAEFVTNSGNVQVNGAKQVSGGNIQRLFHPRNVQGLLACRNGKRLYGKGKCRSQYCQKNHGLFT